MHCWLTSKLKSTCDVSQSVWRIKEAEYVDRDLQDRISFLETCSGEFSLQPAYGAAIELIHQNMGASNGENLPPCGSADRASIILGLPGFEHAVKQAPVGSEDLFKGLEQLDIRDDPSRNGGDTTGQSSRFGEDDDFGESSNYDSAAEDD
jgi:hypothetical protein